MNYRRILLMGAVFGALSVILGAFGAHGVESSIKEWGLDEEAQAKRLHNWDVAVRYQFYHTFALLAVGLLASTRRSKLLASSAIMFVGGIALFSGCLYAWVFTGSKALVMLVPIGGLLFIGGWVLLTVAIARLPVTND